MNKTSVLAAGMVACGYGLLAMAVNIMSGSAKLCTDGRGDRVVKAARVGVRIDDEHIHGRHSIET